MTKAVLETAPSMLEYQSPSQGASLILAFRPQKVFIIDLKVHALAQDGPEDSCDEPPPCSPPLPSPISPSLHPLHGRQEERQGDGSHILIGITHLAQVVDVFVASDGGARKEGGPYTGNTMVATIERPSMVVMSTLRHIVRAGET
ncbi:hypothetical protein DFP72DRAFT_1165831 [Ephemerocybe angulata]|uniref:Uncharacterized protein n=1 Tax=Ephemerocybe angulata TaxID=980116 RepID=A0A8H6I9I0_9AGAR|nr:hypothetical protein DFP72DRAFT_1165831 [Tulosesus angulatus]